MYLILCSVKFSILRHSHLALHVLCTTLISYVGISMASGLYICNVALITSHFDRPLPYVHENQNTKI